MTPPERGCGEVACDAAAVEGEEEEMARGVEAETCWATEEAWVVCLLGCCADAPAALEREAGVGWRKAAKKVERKKGRWVDIIVLCGLVGYREGGLEELPLWRMRQCNNIGRDRGVSRVHVPLRRKIESV